MTAANHKLENAICLTVDVEWAHPDVLADMVRLFDERGLRATFFCTHEGVSVPGHERALHPNFRFNGDTAQTRARKIPSRCEVSFYRHVMETTRRFCPEAVGVRAHSLFYDSQLLPIYRDLGIRYDSTYYLPLTAGLAPVEKENGILEIPIYYMDHLDLVGGTTRFYIEDLHLDRPGLKVFDFHPNIVFINATSEQEYVHSKRHYHEPGRLAEMRNPRRGVRTLFLELLDTIASRPLLTVTMAELTERQLA